MNKSYLTASALALAVTLWMVAGHFVGAPKHETALEAQPQATTPDQMTVEVRTQQARPIARYIVAQGQSEPNRVVTVRAETAGRIAEVVAVEGRTVGESDMLVRIEMNDRQARLKKAEARERSLSAMSPLSHLRPNRRARVGSDLSRRAPRRPRARFVSSWRYPTPRTASSPAPAPRCVFRPGPFRRISSRRPC